MKSIDNTRFLSNDKSIIRLPRQYTERILKHPKNKGIEGTRFEIYTFFTPLETRKHKRKTRPIEEAGDLKVSCFYNNNMKIFTCYFVEKSIYYFQQRRCI